MRHGESMARAHRRLHERQGTPTMIYFGRDYPVTANTYSRTTTLMVGGVEVEADLVLFVSKTEFFVMTDNGDPFAGSQFDMADNRPWPKAGLKLQFASRNFRIAAVHDALAHDMTTPLQLVCVAVTK